MDINKALGNTEGIIIGGAVLLGLYMVYKTGSSISELFSKFGHLFSLGNGVSVSSGTQTDIFGNAKTTEEYLNDLNNQLFNPLGSYNNTRNQIISDRNIATMTQIANTTGNYAGQNPATVKTKYKTVLGGVFG